MLWVRRYDIQHKDTQHNDTQFKGLFVTLGIIDIQHKMTLGIMALDVSWVSKIIYYTECRYAACRYAEYRGALGTHLLACMTF